MPDPVYSDADIEAAISALSQPGRLRRAQELLAQAAPRLHAVLDDSISEGGWFDQAHEQAVREATASDDAAARAAAVRTLIAEETRLGMFVGVAVGLELARELGYGSAPAYASAEDARPESDAPTASAPRTPIDAPPDTAPKASSDAPPASAPKAPSDAPPASAGATPKEDQQRGN